VATDSNRWGPWRLNDHELLGPILERKWDDPGRHYWIELRRCISPAEVLDVIIHTSRHGWASDDTLSGLVHALDDVLDPISNLCGTGRPKTLRSKRLGEILAQAVAR
jgi:hypothetical protein